MPQHSAPDVDEIDSEYTIQGQRRFIVLENPSVENAWGVYDYDGEMWKADPYMSKETATHLRDTNNKSAQRL